MENIYCLLSGNFALSVLDQDERFERCAKHYKIRDLDSGGCYIHATKKSETLQALVASYSGRHILATRSTLTQTLNNPKHEMDDFQFSIF